MSVLTNQPPRVAPVWGVVGLLLFCAAASAQTQETGTPLTDKGTDSGSSDSDDQDEDQENTGHSRLFQDIKDYYTAPLRWDVRDWGYFAGAVALTAGAHHYDTQVRTHFVKQGAVPITNNTHDLQDAIPIVAAVGGSWLYAGIIESTPGHREVGNMIEAGSLAAVTSYMFKFAAGRKRPDQTDDPNLWGKGGSSFPSFHAAAAFAVGAVLAESGNDDYRWLRRFIGYGAVAGVTAFERLKHNAHWLSDDVAGAAVGSATARFILTREAEQNELRNSSGLSVTPLPGGLMLTYHLEIK
jgi:membrane-associated phospholipid phosphatase